MHTFSVISGFLEEPTWQHCILQCIIIIIIINIVYVIIILKSNN